MFFATSRSKFKSRPPKILIYCLKTILLTVLLILLIAQLRAIELPAHSAGATNQNNFFNLFDKLPTPTTQNETSTASSSSADSIDRDDRSTTYNAEPTKLPPDIGELPVQPQPPLSERDLSLTALAHNQTNLDNVTTTTATSLTDSQPVLLAPRNDFEIQASDPSQSDDLFVSPATDQIQLTAREDSGTNVGQQQQQQLPSLAELTAAGTATGLLVHDLMAQPNNMENRLASDGLNEASDASEPDGADLSAKMGQMIGSNQQQDAGQQGDDSFAAMPTSDDDDEPTSGHSPQRPSGAPQLQFTESANRLKAHSLGGGNHQEELRQQVDSGSQEPESEDASPDSIESLMGADGTDLSAANDGAQEQANLYDEQDNSQQQQPSDSNLVNSNDGASLIPRGQQQQFESALDAAGNDDDGDDYDTDRSDVDAPPGQQLQADQTRQSGAVPVMMSTHYKTDDDLVRNSGGKPGELEHNLVAPMRESLVDLNAAAGSYYGKKKKKKVKKIVIKKNKKKKKKKMKYKKIKIVKIKKKKKRKKKVWKPMKGKKHHYHDHGKYYMYAKVPKKKSWEFGFKKGNKKHWIERHEKGHKNKFKTKVKWYDKKSKGKGVHIWDYNHYDKKKKKHH